MTEMTKDVLVTACKKHGGYAAPRLNDQLFLQCRGFLRIANLEEYVDLKVLWLEQNALSDLAGLDALQELVSLFVQNNAISSLRSLSQLRNLRVLNLSHNYLATLDGLGVACPQLETLQISHNFIPTLAACADLVTLKDTLTSVDLSFNRIEIPDGAASPVDFFAQLPRVSVIYFHGNPASRSLRGYRRSMVLRLPQLTYLDERPVFAEERRVVEAWGAGGEAAEAAERAAIGREKREHLESCVRLLSDGMRANREARDRLTRQFDARRAAEREWLKETRRQSREASDAVTAEETQRRAELEERERIEWEERERIEWEERERAELAERERMELEDMKRTELEEREGIEWAEKERAELEEKERMEWEAAADAGASFPADEEMLKEMEDAIRCVLGPLDDGAVSRTALKMGRAVDTVSSRLAAKKSREDVWKRFAQWEARAK